MDSLKKVVVIGPECTGKSELSAFLADTFHTRWVAEYAREYIDELERPYVASDLVEIARGQIEREDQQAKMASRVLICDTDLYVIKIWSMFKYGYCDPWILETINQRRYDLYLLTYVDIPWEDDPQREHPGKRQELYDIYRKELEGQSVPFIEIKGEREERRRTAVDAVRSLLEGS
jgi:NadR type nicotinamide-nucleotide adenylyltransferase